jgi:hypothetical protein
MRESIAEGAGAATHGRGGRAQRARAMMHWGKRVTLSRDMDQSEPNATVPVSGGEAGLPRWFVRTLGALALAHAALFAYGLAHPDAPLRFDRAVHRMDNIRAFGAAGGSAARLELLRELGNPGDYVWQAAIYTLTGESMIGLLLVQIALAALSLVAVYRIALLLTNRREVGRLAVLIYALIPIDAMVPHFLGSEAFSNPLLVFGLLSLVRYVKLGARGRDLVLAGVYLALAGFTRSELMPWLPFALGVVVLRARVVSRRTMLAHGAALAALCLLPLAPMLLARAPEPGRALTPHQDALGYELNQRARAVELRSGDGGVHIEAGDAPLAAWLRVGSAHPVLFVREWALHAIKLLALPDNLDFFRYLGLYEYTGQRSELLHSRGVVGAAVALFREMPGLMAWMLASMVVWAGVWGLIATGVLEALARSDRWSKLVWWALLGLPFVALLSRSITQGESRKRSLFDAVLALFAAVGAVELRRRWRGWERDAPSAGSPGATG